MGGLGIVGAGFSFSSVTPFPTPTGRGGGAGTVVGRRNESSSVPGVAWLLHAPGVDCPSRVPNTRPAIEAKKPDLGAALFSFAEARGSVVGFVAAVRMAGAAMGVV